MYMKNTMSYWILKKKQTKMKCISINDQSHREIITVTRTVAGADVELY